MTPVEQLIEYLNSHSIPYRQSAPMSSYTSFRIGGTLPVLIEPDGERALIEVCQMARRIGVRVLTLGRGSNVLFPDEIPASLAPAVVRTTRLCAISCEGTRLLAACGASLSELCRFAKVQGLSGLEFAYGIPGTLGGALCMNAGAYGGEMCDVVSRVRYYDVERDEVGELFPDELDYGYRHSVFLSHPHWIALEAEICLRSDRIENIEARMQDYMARRREKQPLELPSAGSVFKRPEGYFAGALIEQSGLKGARVGGAMVSPKHAGFIVNTGGATASDVCALIEQIQNILEREKGFRPVTEIRRIPEDV